MAAVSRLKCLCPPPGFECPGCLFYLPNRVRPTLPPFGVIATYKFLGNRAELFGSVEAAEVWSPLITLDPVGRQNLSDLSNSGYGNPWLVQATIGGRIAVDRQRRLWLGGAAKRSHNQESTIESHWNSVTGFASFSFGGR
jgi:hypothetical protein